MLYCICCVTLCCTILHYDSIVLCNSYSMVWSAVREIQHEGMVEGPIKHEAKLSAYWFRDQTRVLYLVVRHEVIYY